jgi:putative membrane protein
MIVKFSQAERDRVVAAIVAAERHTSGEIVVTAARESDDYIHVPLHIAAAAAFVAGLVVALAQWRGTWFEIGLWELLTAELLVFVAVALTLSLEGVRYWVTPRRLMVKYAHRNAASQFLAINAHMTRGRNGVLIFVSQLERYCEIIGDTAVAAKVPQSEWQAIVDAMLPMMRHGKAADALVTATERCGEVLSRYFPPKADNPDELPDRFVILE